MIKKIALYGKTINEEFIPHFRQLIEKLNQSEIDIYCFKPLFEMMEKDFECYVPYKALYSSHDDLPLGTQLMLCIGGDGTFLETVTYLVGKNIPVLGINSGRLGFLATIARNDISQAIDALIQGKYCIEHRTLLEVITEKNHFGRFNMALNDVTVQKKDSTLITIQAYLDGEFLNSYWTDGLIIATPTGSTAYSLSVGGPIVIPYAKDFIISPIAPHNLTVRPIIVPDFYEITLKIEARSSKFTVSLDRRSEEFDVCEVLKLKKSEYKLQVIKLFNTTFYETLRNKLMWGQDKRN